MIAGRTSTRNFSSINHSPTPVESSLPFLGRNGKTSDLHDLNVLSRFITRPGLNRTPDRIPGLGSDTISLERDRDRTLHQSDPRYIVSDSGMSSLKPGNVVFVSGEALKPTRPAQVAILQQTHQEEWLSPPTDWKST